MKARNENRPEPDQDRVPSDADLTVNRLPENVGLAGRLALVTGASSGVGRGIALALAHEGAELCVVGRNPVALAETAAAARQFSEVTDLQIDLTVEAQLQGLLQYVERNGGRLDVLVHSAGILHMGTLQRARIEDLDAQFAANVRAPYMLTQQLLPPLIAARGQVVFLNSSAGLSAKRPEVGQYAATKHALRALTESIREELNPKGIRVLSVYLGRAATPMQQAVHRVEGRVYRPETLLQPEDVASVVVQALTLPMTAEVTDISIRPMVRPMSSAKVPG